MRVRWAILFLVTSMYAPLSFPTERIGPIYHAYPQGNTECVCVTHLDTEKSTKSNLYRDVLIFSCIMEISPGINRAISVPILLDVSYWGVERGDSMARKQCSRLAQQGASLKLQ